MLVQEGRADLAIPMISGINFTGPSLGTILRHLPSRGAGTSTLSWQPSSQKPSTPYLYPKRHHRQLLLVATWHGHCSRLYVRHRRVPLSPSSRTCTLGTQDSSTVALLRTFLSMLLRHRQFRGAAEIAKLSPRLRWRRFVLLGLARRGSTPRVEAQLGGSLLPKWLVDVVAHTRLGRRHPTTGLLRHWATRRARTPAHTRNGFESARACAGCRPSEAHVSAARTLHNAGEQTAFGNIILDGQVSHAHVGLGT
jgi:hypothetical protein